MNLQFSDKQWEILAFARLSINGSEPRAKVEVGGTWRVQLALTKNFDI